MDISHHEWLCWLKIGRLWILSNNMYRARSSLNWIFPGVANKCKGLAIKESTYHNLQYLENVLSHNLNKFDRALTKIVHFIIATDCGFTCSFFNCQQKHAMHGFYLSNHATTRNILPLCLYQQHSLYCHKLKETLHAGDRLLLSSKIIIPEIKMMSATLDQNCN